MEKEAFKDVYMNFFLSLTRETPSMKPRDKSISQTNTYTNAVTNVFTRNGP